MSSHVHKPADHARTFLKWIHHRRWMRFCIWPAVLLVFGHVQLSLAQTVKVYPATEDGIDFHSIDDTKVQFDIEFGSSPKVWVRLCRLIYREGYEPDPNCDELFEDPEYAWLRQQYEEGGQKELYPPSFPGIYSGYYCLQTTLEEGGPYLKQWPYFWVDAIDPWDPLTETPSEGSGPHSFSLSENADVEKARVDINNVRKSCVDVKAWHDSEPEEYGTGFVINRSGHVVTAAHVVADGKGELSRRIEVVLGREDDGFVVPGVALKYRVLGRPFPPHDADYQLVVLVPENGASDLFDGTFPFLLRIVDYARDEGSTRLEFRPPSKKLWVCGRPALKLRDPADAVTYTTPTLGVGPRTGESFSSGWLGDYLKFNSGTLDWEPQGWSGAPVLDESGRVWAVYVYGENVTRYAHWAYDIASQYEIWEKDGTLKDALYPIPPTQSIGENR